MIRALCAVLLVLASPTHEQSTPFSPCPNVFSYEPPGTEPGRWYGVVNLSTDSTLHSLWLNIVLDSKADILGNWVGDVSTSDNIDFKIENTKMVIAPGPAVAVRFFVQYSQVSKAPRLLAIRLNGREICNANTPKPSSDISSENVNTRRPYTTTESSRNTPRPTQKPVKTTDKTRPSDGSNRPSEEGPVYVRPPPQLHGGGLSINRDREVTQNGQNVLPSQNTQNNQKNSNKGTRPAYSNPPEVPQNVLPSQTTQKNRNKGNRPPYSDTGEVSSQSTDIGSRPTYNNNNNYDFTPSPPRRPPSVSNTPADTDYFAGGPNFIPIKNITNSRNPQQLECGLVTLNNPLALVVNGKPTLEGQWPWQIALYQTHSVNNKYICGGTLVSHLHVITAAHCVTIKNSQRPVLKNTLTVFLGKHNLRTSVDGVQIRFVEDVIIHPDYNGTTFSRDISILRMREPVTYSHWVRPACLWPDNQVDLNNVIGKRGSVVGWGYDDTGVATEDLSLVEMPVVSQETCIRSYGEFFVRFTSEYTYCAGFRDGTSVCNGDSGGGMVFRIGSAWYVRGLVSVSVARDNEYRCDPTHYVIFTDLAKFLPWIRENVSDY